MFTFIKNVFPYRIYNHRHTLAILLIAKMPFSDNYVKKNIMSCIRYSLFSGGITIGKYKPVLWKKGEGGNFSKASS